MDPTNNVASFLVDTTPPTVPVLVSPVNSFYWGSASVILEWENGTDTNGIGNVEVEFNGSPIFPGITNKLEIAVTSGSINNWRIRNFDVIGNTSDWSETWQFTIDTENPVVNLISPSTGIITNGVPELQWSVSSISPIASNIVTLDSVEYSAGTGTTFNISVNEGVHSWQVKSINILGRTGTSELRNFTYDITPPEIATNALIFPFAGVELFEGETTNIIWRADRITDNIDGTNLTITKISVFQTNDTIAEVALVTNDIQNIIEEIKWEVPLDLSGGDEIYMIRFEVVDSSSFTNSRYFYENSFTIVPEPRFIWIFGFLNLWIFGRKN